MMDGAILINDKLYYIKFNNTDKKFFKINSSDYKKVNDINYNYINVDEKFKKLINLE